MYVGQVDNSQGLPLGVQIIEAKPLFQKFRLEGTDDVIATAIIKARSINEDVYNISNECYLEFTYSNKLLFGKSKKVQVKGQVQPQNFEIGYTGEQFDQRMIECVVRGTDITAATVDSIPVNTVVGQVVFNTTFNFTTSGYMTYAFMDKNLFARLRADNREPWREMGLSSGQMMARYTPGPIMVGMPADSTPYPIDSTAASASLPAFGVTFSNAFVGRGGIKTFDKTYVYVPKQLDFVSECTPKEYKIAATESSKHGYGADYKEFELKNLSRPANELYVTARCPMSISKASSPDDLLGLSGSGIYTIFLTSRYTYSIDTFTSVNMLFNQSRSTSTAGLVPNMLVYENKESCKNGVPYCTGSTNDGMCYCPYKYSADEVYICTWEWGDGKNDKAAAAVDAGSCHRTTIPPACASAGISCSGHNCKCIYEINGGSKECNWLVEQYAAGPEQGCKDYTGETS
jgi:hypothetical protein